MRKFENDGKAGFVLNDTLQCICENVTHHDYKRIFGGKCEDGWGEKYIIFDNVNNLYLPTYDKNVYNHVQNTHYQHYKLFNNITGEKIIIDFNEFVGGLEQKSNGKNYFDDCPCDYCNYMKNLAENKFETCYCCKDKIFTRDVFDCYDCGSKVCINCHYISYGCDYYCYECRKFGDNKNAHAYSKTYEYDREEDWYDANREY